MDLRTQYERNIAYQESACPSNPNPIYYYYGRPEMELSIANHQVYYSDDKLCKYSTIRLQYEKLFHETKAFVGKIQDLASALSMLGDSFESWARISALIIEYSIYLLQVEGLHFERFLCSQQASIYSMLDDALLRLCLAEWESVSDNTPWNTSIKPLTAALDSGVDKIDQWNPRGRGLLEESVFLWAESKAALKFHYFSRTRAFMYKSLQVYRVRKTVSDCSKGRLPVELVDVIVQDILSYEGLPTGRLRSLYLPSGKGKA